MKSTNSFSRTIPVLASALLLATADADPITPPPVINYQGRVMQNGANFNGTGHFKFMLYNANPSGTPVKVVWKNDGTLTTDEPTTSVQLSVQDGQFSVGLGNTALTGMATALPREAFGPPPGTSDSPGLSLRIWFRPTASGTFSRFSPDVAVQSVPFAFNALSLGGKTAADMVTAGDPIHIENSDFNVWRPNTSLASSVTGQHAVAGLDFFRGVNRISASFSGDWSFAVLSPADSSISFLDLTSGPDTLARRAVVRDNIGGFTKLGSPTDLDVDGDRVYVTSATENAVTLLTYEGTSRVATLRAEYVDGANGLTELQGATAVRSWFSGDGASAETIGVASTTAITIIRVSTVFDPAADPELQSVITASSPATLPEFVAPSALETVKDSLGRRLLFAACPTTNAVFAFDVTIPEAPALRWSRVGPATGASAMVGPARFGVRSDFESLPHLTVLCPSSNSVILLNMETGAFLGAIRDNQNGFNNLTAPSGAFSQDGLLLIAAAGSSTVYAADVLDPEQPRVLSELVDGTGGFNLLGGCSDVIMKAPVSGGTNRLTVVSAVDHAITVTGGFPAVFGEDILFTALGNVGIGTRRPAEQLEVAGTTQGTVRISSNSGGDAVLQLLEYDSTKENIRDGFEWRFDGTSNALQLNGLGTSGNAGLKARFSGSGNLVLEGSLTQGSDRERKTGIVPVDPAAVLEKVAALPVSEWSYIGEDGVRHLGPMSQDFRAAFGLGATEKGIASVDADGVALAAIKALKAEMDALKAENAKLREEVRRISGAQAVK